MRVTGLFAGVGGLELGMQRAGHDTEMLCELDPYAQAVLRHRFPGTTVRPDVRELRSVPQRTTVLTAGFPCQDLSQAGRTAGIGGANSGLVNVVFDLLARRRVKWVVLENVPNMLRLDRGAAMARVVAGFEALGYRWAYRVVDSRAFGLPQRRLRVFVVASRDEDPRDVLFVDSVDQQAMDDGSLRGVNAVGFYWTEGNRGLGWTHDAVPTLKGGSGVGIPSPPAIWYPKRAATHAFRVPTIEDAERLQGFAPGWTDIVQERGGRPRWKMVGNAVSVPVAEWIGRRLQDPGAYDVGRDLAFDQDDGWPIAAYGGPKSRATGVAVSSTPGHCERPSLAKFIEGAPLSKRAAAGFLFRWRRSSLRRRPEFEEALAGYVCDEAAAVDAAE